MMEEFSGGYYKTEMTVQEYSQGPVIENGLYDYINRKIYAQTNAPITLRVGMDKGPYFPVESEAAVPTDVLALPKEWMDDMMINASDPKSVFILKPAFSYFVNQSVNQRSTFEDHNINK